MKPEVTEEVAGREPRGNGPACRPSPAVRPGVRFGVSVLVLSACFGRPLYDLARFAAGSDLFSHILLVPVVAGYLIWHERSRWRAVSAGSSRLFVLPLFLGLAVLAGYGLACRRGWRPALADYLCLTVLAYYCFLVAAGLFFFGGKLLRALAFPVGFLVFIVPLPLAAVNGLEVFFQHTSAYAANMMLALTGIPFMHNGLVFQLPGISLQVGQECSGIHSSLVLFITGLLAGHVFLRSRWKKGLLAGFVIPLGILRNGFRIATIATLCVEVDPSMINSPIHRRGGPLFFALSLVPFFLFLLFLRRSESGGEAGRPKERA